MHPTAGSPHAAGGGRHTAAAATHVTCGLMWLLVFGSTIWTTAGWGAAVVWVLCALATLAVSAKRFADSPDRGVWSQSILWWLGTFVAPLVLLWVLVSPRLRPAPETGATETMDAAVLARLDEVERQVRGLQAEVESLRSQSAAPARAGMPSTAPTAPAPRPAPSVEARPRPTLPPRRPEPSRPASPPRPPLVDLERLRRIDFLGAKALAWAGGVVTLLGVVFFFVLAVNRGWIGPGTRVALGGCAAALVFAAGLWLRRLYGETHSSLAAVGAGIAGGYATLLAAVALYDLVPEPAALAGAAAIAATGLAVSLAWRSELVAGLGLVGAIAAVALEALQGGVTELGTAFVWLVLAASAAVAVRLRWPKLLVSASLVSAPQVLALVLEAANRDWGVVTLAAAFAALWLAAGLAWQERFGGAELVPLATGLVLASFAVAWIAAASLFDGDDRGFALLAAFAVYGTVAALLYRQEARREQGVLVLAVALAACAIGLADVLSGASLGYTWAAESVVLAFLGRRLRDARLLVGALAYLALALFHLLALDAPPERLFVALRHPASGAGVAAAVGVAALAFARLGRAWETAPTRGGMLAWLGRSLEALGHHRRAIAAAVASVGFLLIAFAASLSILELFEAVWRDGGTTAAFERGHVAVTGAWAVAGLAAVAAGVRRGSPVFVGLGFAWFGVALVKTVGYDALELSAHERSYAFLLVAACLFAAAPLRQLATRPVKLAPEAAPALLTTLALALAAVTTLADGSWWGVDADGAAWLAVAAVYGLAAVGVFGRDGLRDLATLLWGIALAVAAAAEALILDGTWLVLAWAASAAVAAWLSSAASERRFLAASAAYLGCAAGLTLGVVARPDGLWVANERPAHGVPAVLLTAGAALILAAFLSGPASALQRTVAAWAVGILCVYAASLGILGIAELVSSESVQTDFQRGHTAVSALWGVLGLALLYLGLTGRRGALRLGGLALLAVAVSKIFLYDLPALSSVTRALSFLAVGAVLLLGGFFIQRVGSREAPG